jgi:hypothetical protein
MWKFVQKDILEFLQKIQQRRRNRGMIISSENGALANEHKVQGGWVVVQIPHLTFGGNQGVCDFIAHVWLVALTLFVVARSLITHLTWNGHLLDPR